MRYVFGTLALLAAIIIVGYSATTLFVAAFNASAEPWQQILNGTGAAAIVVWEATAVLLIGLCWHRGYRPIAVIAILALIAAMGATLSWEMRAVIGGQADKFASREVEADKLTGQKSDLVFLRKRQEALVGKASTPAIARELDWLMNRIDRIEKDRSSSHAVSEVLPQAAWAARVFGGGEQLWRDVFLAIPLLFWMIARIVAVPLAVAGMTGSVKKPQEARTAPISSEGTGGAHKPVSPASETQRVVGTLREVGFTKHNVYDPDFSMWQQHVRRVEPDPIKERLDLARKADNPPSPEVGQPTEQAAEAAKEPAVIQQVSPVRLAVNNDSFEEIEPRPQPKSKKKQVKRAEGSVVRWLDACTTQTPDKRVKATSRECRRSYIAFCEMEGTHPVGHKQQSRMMSAALRKGDHGRGPRNGDGAVWLGLIVMQPSANPLRRRA
jgi:hypothetical protein